MSILFKGGTVVSAKDRRQVDVRIDGEKIIEMGTNLKTKDSNIVDVSGCFLLPGFIDAHTHLELNNGKGSMGTADNFYTGSKAAVAKGTTTVIDMATPSKGSSLKDCLKVWDQLARGNSSCDYTYHMSIIEWNPSIKAEINEMIDAGITSFKMYMAYDNLRTTDGEIFEAMSEIRKFQGMLGIHCENGDMVNKMIAKFVAEGKRSPHYHPLTRPDSVEAEAVERYLMIADLVGLSVNIVHLSSKRSLEAVQRARARNQKVYVETCPQYLVLDDHLYDGPEFEGAKYVCSPPLRKISDQKALWDGVINGQVNTISTDHCSFNFEGQKTIGKDDFSKIPNGMPGVETRPELIYTYGVTTGKISLERMIGLLSEDIAKQFSMYPQKGIIQVGSDADIVVWDPNTTGIISATTQLQNVDYTPYDGMQTTGSAKSVYLRGQKIAEEGQVVLEKQGKFIFRKSTKNN
ncbi:dihydropyrimidinase [Enterococcus haemoperoxidus ATCC BAA-382]|uniref:Dihydropyrimidinase n=1 Tax=Enterococcus haemoperoxidus ATCC BAA-382 TaxID=1158608 RepID=R2QAE9_9ENTE|nr:dihydropyrimidinase [Enterococcus haemoperoxidus]EOH92178.1 dihydropyrimidinase [Enterococcus haemoperoxidus ATCC BAA-382]EOT61863.1 dihydropyrimidinase [Enterococcus haemoperoxidus ATCC BAA-382]OJG54227.1 dihydropyrimidinase [Enterococcus haemoperoxidus]